MTRRSAGALPILMYHHVSRAPGLVTISPETFRAHIAALAAAGWRSVGLDEVERFLAGERLPARSCVISFDDGYLDNWLHAHPILAGYGMKAVLFVVTGWIGDGPPRTAEAMTPDHRECKRRIASGDADSVIVRWSEVDAMRAAGTFEFHSHTHSHVRFDQTISDRDARRQALATDLAASRDTLQQRLGIASRHLCWPQGYYDDDYMAVARATGFDHLYTTENRINTADASPLTIGRFVTKERDGRWLASRTDIYSRPWLGRLYRKLQ